MQSHAEPLKPLAGGIHVGYGYAKVAKPALDLWKRTFYKKKLRVRGARIHFFVLQIGLVRNVTEGARCKKSKGAGRVRFPPFV